MHVCSVQVLDSKAGVVICSCPYFPGKLYGGSLCENWEPCVWLTMRVCQPSTEVIGRKYYRRQYQSPIKTASEATREALAEHAPRPP